MFWQNTGGKGHLGKAELLQFFERSTNSIGRLEAITGLADLDAREEMAEVLRQVTELEVEEGNEILAFIVEQSDRCSPALSIEGWRSLRTELMSWGNERTRTSLISLGRIFRDTESFTQARQILQNRDLPVANRVQALREMLLFDSSSSYLDFIDAWREPALRLEMIPLLSDLKVGFSSFAGNVKELSEEERQALVKEMLESRQGAAELIDLILAGDFSPDDMKGGNLALLEVVNEDLAERFRELYGSNNADALWTRCRGLVRDRTGDKVLGQKVFQTLCASCHRFQGGEAELGPDLSGYDFRDSDALLHNIIFPSATVAPDARMMVVTLKDGKVVVGTSLGETVNGDLRMKTTSGESVITKSRLENVEVREESTMPKGLLEGASDDEVRGLIQYLQGGEE